MDRTCADCGASVADRGVSAYLCRPCARARLLARKLADYRRVMADPLLAASRRSRAARIARRAYVPTTNPRKTTLVCAAVGCGKTFARWWPNTNQFMCRPCQTFYDHEADNERQRRRYRERKLRRAA